MRAQDNTLGRHDGGYSPSLGFVSGLHSRLHTPRGRPVRRSRHAASSPSPRLPTLERCGVIRRRPGVARSIHVLSTRKSLAKRQPILSSVQRSRRPPHRALRTQLRCAVLESSAPPDEARRICPLASAAERRGSAPSDPTHQRNDGAMVLSPRLHKSLAALAPVHRPQVARRTLQPCCRCGRLPDQGFPCACPPA